MNTLTSRLQKRLKAKEEVENYGITRPFGIRHGTWIIVGFIIVLALVAGLISPLITSHVTGPDVITAVIAVGALLLGYQQWRAARHEISLDTFYTRLQLTNQKLDQWPAARKLLQYVPTTNDSSTYDEEALYQRAMYTYLELDNLEYAIIKYKLGYMSSSHLLRALKTFQMRCKSPDFCELALQCTIINDSYDSTLVEIINKVCSKKKRPEENEKKL